MHLINIVPKIEEIFLWALLVHLRHVIHQRINQTYAHKQIQKCQLDNPLFAAFAGFQLFLLKEIADVKVEEDDIKRVNGKTDVVELTSIFVPSEFN
jgi:hypothetical protein